jgi:hypothetical protein|tara:strand:- start:993 stop:1346 length:354 start_codon:yes stop_codon:yes gene_type:complete
MKKTFVAVSCAGWARNADADTALREARWNGMAGAHGLWTIEEGQDFEITPGQLMITTLAKPFAVKIGEFHVDDSRPPEITLTPTENWLNPPRGDRKAVADQRAAAWFDGKAMSAGLI